MQVTININIDDRLAAGVKRVVKSRVTWVTLLLGAIGSAVAYAGAPFSPFSSGTTISSSAVNADFEELYASSWTLGDAGVYYVENGSNDAYVGIGTDTPADDLYVYSPGGAQNVAGFESSNTSQGTFIQLNDNVGGHNVGASIGSLGGDLTLNAASGSNVNIPNAHVYIYEANADALNENIGLMVNRGSTTSLDAGTGMIQVGGDAVGTDTNMSIDFNQIQVRTAAGAATSLYLNDNGGTVLVGNKLGANLSVNGTVSATGAISGSNYPSTLNLFSKGGNNGTNSCTVYCASTKGGAAGSCAGAYDEVLNNAISCDDQICGTESCCTAGGKNTCSVRCLCANGWF